MDTETTNTKSFLKAKHKVETLKGFYQHLLVFCIINAVIIGWQSNFFSDGVFQGFKPEFFFTTFMWGIGLVCHFLYVLFVLNFSNSFIKKWEERKIEQFMNDES